VRWNGRWQRSVWVNASGISIIILLTTDESLFRTCEGARTRQFRETCCFLEWNVALTLYFFFFEVCRRENFVQSQSAFCFKPALIAGCEPSLSFSRYPSNEI
jgi:hypothetical protein